MYIACDSVCFHLKLCMDSLFPDEMQDFTFNLFELPFVAVAQEHFHFPSLSMLNVTLPSDPTQSP